MVARAAKIELTPNEASATKAGGKKAGAYLEGIGKTDLATMSGEEWSAFCAAMVEGYVVDLQRQADEYVPF